MNRERLTAVALAAVLVSGCSSTPRQFTPELAAPPADQSAYEQTLANCQIEAKQSALGKKHTPATVVAKGAGGAAVGSAASSGAAYSASVAAISAAVVAAPIAGLVWGISRVNRAKTEKRINETARTCLLEDGYEVARWNRVKKPRKVDGQLANSEQVALVK